MNFRSTLIAIALGAAMAAGTVAAAHAGQAAGPESSMRAHKADNTWGRHGPMHHARRGVNPERFEQRMQARLDRIEERLSLNAEQMPLWRDYRAALLNLRSGPPEHRAPTDLSAPERTAALIERMEVRLQALRALADVQSALYGALDAGQRAVLDGMHHRGPGRR